MPSEQIIERVRLLDSDLQKLVMSGPLSRLTTFSLHVTGPYGPREIDNLIRMLQLQREWLAYNEEPQAIAAEAADAE